MIRWIVSILLAVGIAIAVFYVAMYPLASPSTQQKITLRVPDTQFMGILPLYVAEEKGFFSQEGIRVQWLDVKDPGQAGKLFFSGQADFLMTTFANLLPAEVREPGTVRLLYPIYESEEHAS